MSEEQEKLKLKEAYEKRFDHWAAELEKVKWLRRPNGNWNLNQGDQNVPQKVAGYWRARKKRQRKIELRLKTLSKRMESLGL